MQNEPSTSQVFAVKAKAFIGKEWDSENWDGDIGADPDEVTVQFGSIAQPCLTLCNHIDRGTPGLPIHHQLLVFTQTHVHWVGGAILCRPLLLPAVFPNIRVFSNESAVCIRWPKYWSFSFNINPSSEQSGLISFSMDWLDLLAVQGTLKSLLQHHSSKASILRCSGFFIVQLLHPYMTTEKKHSLD